MAGIGKYGKKSKGNRGYKMSPPSLLKMVADLKSSPITSPYKQEEVVKTEEQLAAEVEATKGNADGIAESLNVPKVNKTKTIASKIGNTLVGAFTSGLDAVYGQGKVIPGNKLKFHNPKKKKEEKEFGTTALDNDEK
tara:strand:+ start:386 stop:796 length:411 start_codon:yes stop_codon:yes gene_type:complete